MSIRAKYEDQGADHFYRQSGNTYRNPHEHQLDVGLGDALRRWSPDLSNVLDLATGSGEITLALRRHRANKITGIDPYTFEAYRARTGQSAERFRFDQIAGGALANRHYSLIVCSFAMHLCEPSRLPSLCLQLSLIAPGLLIFTPHKRPIIRSEWGWNLQGEFVVQRVRARMYNSTNTHGSTDR